MMKPLKAFEWLIITFSVIAIILLATFHIDDIKQQYNMQSRRLKQLTYEKAVLTSPIKHMHFLAHNLNQSDNRQPTIQPNTDLEKDPGLDEKTPLIEPDGIHVYENLVQLEKIQAMNLETIGWLQIPETKIDYPVMQTGDNAFYLEHDFDKNRSVYGALFLDYECTVAEADCFNLVIYGHNMKNGTMFGGLQQYKQADYFAAHPDIYLQLKEGTEKYTVFSAFVTNALPDYKQGEPDYRQLFFSDTNEKLNWLAYFQSQSLHMSDFLIENTARVLTLSTCSSDFNEARMVIMAVRVEG